MDLPGRYVELSEQFDRSLRYVSRCFGEVRLPEYPGKFIDWCYSPLLGIFKEI